MDALPKREPEARRCFYEASGYQQQRSAVRRVHADAQTSTLNGRRCRSSNVEMGTAAGEDAVQAIPAAANVAVPAIAAAAAAAAAVRRDRPLRASVKARLILNVLKHKTQATGCVTRLDECPRACVHAARSPTLDSC